MTWHTKQFIEKNWTIRGCRIKFEWRDPKSPMGRFGGGWNWNVGVQVGGSTVILNLLVCSLRFDRKRRENVGS
jgi:hypothetical protein